MAGWPKCLSSSSTFVFAPSLLPVNSRLHASRFSARTARAPHRARQPLMAASPSEGPEPAPQSRSPVGGAAGAASTSTARASPPPPPPTSTPRFACPTCRAPVSPVSDRQCRACDTKIRARDGFVEMLPKESTELRLLSLIKPLLEPPGKSLFQNPLVSFAYERGWRDVFRTQGFPGPDVEYAMMERFFLSNEKDLREAEPRSKITLDLSCGSGFMARRMDKRGRLGRVVALDYSAAMLREAIRRGGQDGVSFDAVRADAARLPFENKSIDYVHAGAAMHLWERPQDVLAEVFRVLVPGGRFFATVFLDGAFEGGRAAVGRRQYSTRELRFLFQSAGFSNVSVEESLYCGIVRCEKDKE